MHNARAGIKYTAVNTDPDGDRISYLFDWGDGSDSGWRGSYTSGTTAFATHLWSSPGTYYVKVKAKDEQGAKSAWSASMEVKVNSRPTADFSYSPSSPATEGYIYFTDQSTDTDGHITSRNWDFGDGSYDSGINPTHRYDSAGTYTVTLTVEDDMGAVDVASKSIGVTGIIKVAIYNVSELESDPLVGQGGMENFSYSGTYGMKKAMLGDTETGYTFTEDGKTYRFEPHILKATQIANGGLISGNYKILLAPGDNDYWEDGSNVRDQIKTFVESGGGYIGTCGGAAIACKDYRRPSDGTTIENSGFYMGLVNATAWSSWEGTGNHAYFDRHTMFDEDDCGVGDLGGIPMKNHIENAIGPFENYESYTTYDSSDESITLRYWGGPWFTYTSTCVTGIAKYNKEPGDEPTTQLHKANGDIVETDIKNEWSIIIQEAINGKGRIVLFGCHPEHLTWDWGSGQVCESDLGTLFPKYIYSFPPPQPGEPPNPQNISAPPHETYDVLQDCARWIAEEILQR